MRTTNTPSQAQTYKSSVWFSNLKQIIEDTDSVYGKIFDFLIQGLIVLSIITFSIETLPNISQNTRSVLRSVEVGSVFIFTIEYFLRIIVADKKFKFIFSFYGIIDVISILPFYIAMGIDLRSLRALRLLRLFRTFKLVRYNKAIQHLHLAMNIAKEEIILFLCLTAIILYFSAVGIYYFENPVQPDVFSSIFHSLWWGVATLTTVGYGDIYPITVGGKIFTFFVLMIGLGIVAVPAGLVSSALSEAKKRVSKK